MVVRKHVWSNSLRVYAHPRAHMQGGGVDWEQE